MQWLCSYQEHFGFRAARDFITSWGGKAQKSLWISPEFSPGDVWVPQTSNCECRYFLASLNLMLLMLPCSVSTGKGRDPICLERKIPKKCEQNPAVGQISGALPCLKQKNKRNCIKRRWRMLWPLISLPAQEWCGNQVGFAQKYQEVINNIYYSSVFFHW